MNVSTDNSTATANKAVPPSDPTVGRRRSINDFLKPEWAILPVLIVVIIAGSLVNSSFLSFNNIYGVLQQASELGILTMGLTLVLITGKFDLSLESTFGLAPMVGAFLFLDVSGGSLGLLNSPIVALVAIFVVGAFIGVVNGFLVVYLKFNAFIATLATLILLRGISLGLTRGQTLSGLPPALTIPGQASVANLPLAFI